MYPIARLNVSVVVRLTSNRSMAYESLSLPDGYWIERDADVLVLHRPDGSIVATFSAGGADLNEIERVAREDAEQG